MKKKVKRYQDGGLAGIAQSAQDLMGNVDSMANTINYGSATPGGTSQPVGFEAVAGMKKGGKVKKMSSGGSADRPGKAMAEHAVKRSIAESMLKEAPDDYTRSQISNRAAQAGREAEAEVKREMRGVVKKRSGGSVSARADGCAQRGKTRGKMV